MSERQTLTEQQAEELRLCLKEAGWALKHLRQYYELAKPEGAPSADDTDPNQLTLFETEPWQQQG